LDTIGLDFISIEDAHRHNDLNILRLFKNTKVIFGVIKIAESTIETVEEICDRIRELLK
jgi:5-methyltetrahydropteroyltriglutamate--homocysteine methyltransferase